jgi:hypothetical protein
VPTTLNKPISEGGANSSHMHILAKCQSYRGLKLPFSDTQFMTMITSMLTYHRFQENLCMLVINVRHMIVNE